MSTKESIATLSATQTLAWKDPAPAGAKLETVFIGPDPDGLGGFQIAIAAVVGAPTRALLDKLFNLRKGNCATGPLCCRPPSRTSRTRTSGWSRASTSRVPGKAGA